MTTDKREAAKEAGKPIAQWNVGATVVQEIDVLPHGEIVALGIPIDEEDPNSETYHNCDQMGCGQCHVLWRFDAGFDAAADPQWIPFNGDNEVERGNYWVTVDDDSVDEPTVFLAHWDGFGFLTADHYQADIGTVEAYVAMVKPKPFVDRPQEER